MSSVQPVFVDISGRRRKLLRRAGFAAGAVLAGFLVLIGIGLASGSGVPLTPWVEPEKARPRVGSLPGGGGVTPEPKGGGGMAGPSGKAGRPSGSKPGSVTAVTAPALGPKTTTGTQTAISQAPVTTPAASPAVSHPGNSQAKPPAWGRNKKSPSP